MRAPAGNAFAEQCLQAPPAPDSLHEKRDEGKRFARSAALVMASARKVGARLGDCNGRAFVNPPWRDEARARFEHEDCAHFFWYWMPVIAWMLVIFAGLHGYDVGGTHLALYRAVSALARAGYFVGDDRAACNSLSAKARTLPSMPILGALLVRAFFRGREKSSRFVRRSVALVDRGWLGGAGRIPSIVRRVAHGFARSMS